jgi:hypothetical protein
MTASRPSDAQLRRAAQAVWGAKLPAPPAKIRRFTPYRNAAGTMLGFLLVETPSDLVLNGLKVIIGPRGTRWIAMPDIKRRDQDDRPVLGEGGKPVYDPVIEFRDRAARDRFGVQIFGALRAAHPELFDEERG